GELEQRVRARTAELEAANAALRAEVAERTRVVEALARSEARFKSVFDSNMLGILFWDASGDLTDANQRFLELVGHSRDELRTGHVARCALSPTEWTQAEAPAFAELQRDGVCAPFEMEYRRPDGTRVPVLLGAATLDPSRTSGVAFALDLGDRRKADEARRRLVAIVESSDDAIISKDLSGVITSWNRGAELLFGYAAADIVGRPILTLIPPERAAEEPDILARIARGERLDHFETERVRQDGRVLPVSITISPIHDDRGVIVGASKIVRDISARHQAEARVQAQLARLDLLNRTTRAIAERQDLDSIFQVVLRCLEERLPVDFCCMCRFDRAAHALTVTNVGVLSEALAATLTMPVRATIPIDQNGLSLCVAGSVVYEGDLAQVDFPFPRRLLGGGLRAFVAAPLIVDGTVFGVLITARAAAGSFSSGECEFLKQVSEHVALAAHQNQMHTALQKSYDDLRQTQQAVLQQERLRALGQMASGIAHDINNAISPTMLYTDMLLEQEPGLSEKGRRNLQVIERSLGDVAHTVARLGEFFRQGDDQTTLVPIDLNELVPQVLDLTRARWSDMPQRRGVVVRMEPHLAPGLPTVLGVASEIREALVNLIFNAVDAMPTGGVVTVTTSVAAKAGSAASVQVEVADTGQGMDEETRRRCLEPFFTTKGERGSGLGLAMVYGIAQRHHAALAIVSTPGQGTTVGLAFPMPVASVAPELGALAALATGPLRLLVIDDDPLLLASLREALSGDGHEVVTADHGRAGIAAFTAALGSPGAFAAVFTDLGMPHVDGREVAAAVKALSPGTPVILLTGWGRRLAGEAEVPRHVDSLLSKPPKLQELRAALARLIPPMRP
ncbi:MAG: PAS domain S-box protein, partial [Planctomycetes bacterium]|nr:PAS domain S-box protein [Planctomycetota bacterium]